MKPLRVKIRRLPPARELPLPAYQSEGASGMDLVAAVTEPLELVPGQRVLVPTGLILEIPPEYEAQVRPRSGLAAKFGLSVVNAPGTIDSDYRGEIKVILINLGEDRFVVERGMRIAQLVFCPVTRATWEEADTLEETARGSGGFGHTGTGQAGPGKSGTGLGPRRRVRKRGR